MLRNLDCETNFHRSSIPLTLFILIQIWIKIRSLLITVLIFWKLR